MNMKEYPVFIYPIGNRWVFSSWTMSDKKFQYLGGPPDSGLGNMNPNFGKLHWRSPITTGGEEWLKRALYRGICIEVRGKAF